METHQSWGHQPLIGFKVVHNVARPPAALVEQFHKFFVPSISDLVGQLYTMDSSIRPLYRPMKRLVGTALTVKVPPGDNIAVFEALRMVQPGDVLVVDARGYTEVCGSGAGSLAVPISRGLAGVVVHGAWRDVTELQAMDFPVYGRAVTPFSGPKRGPGEINVPVCCGGVIVHPGDVVVCDSEGGVVVPREHVEQVADALQGHELKTSPEQWGLETLADKMEDRHRHFRQVFEAQRGIDVDASKE